MKVLVVDDSSTMRRIIVNTLSRLGYKDTVQGADGVEAWEAMQANPDIGVVITDWNMPNMNGEVVVDAVRANKEWNKTRIVMATTEGGKANVLKMIKKGANGYMVKPFKEEAIFKTLDTITARMPKK